MVTLAWMAAATHRRAQKHSMPSTLLPPPRCRHRGERSSCSSPLHSRRRNIRRRLSGPPLPRQRLPTPAAANPCRSGPSVSDRPVGLAARQQPAALCHLAARGAGVDIGARGRAGRHGGRRAHARLRRVAPRGAGVDGAGAGPRPGGAAASAGAGTPRRADGRLADGRHGRARR